MGTAWTPMSRDRRLAGMTVIDWLLDSDPAIRWQVMRDLTHEPADVDRRRAVQGRDRGLGRPAARAPGAGRPVGRRGVVARVDRHVPRPGAAAPVRARSRERAGPAGHRPGPRARHLGRRLPGRDALGRQPVLRGRGRAVHQRQRRRHRLVLRRGHGAARRAAPRRAAPRWRLELRGRERRDGVVVRDDDQRPRGPARTRARDRRLGRGRRGTPPRRGSTCSSAGCSVGSRPGR